MGELEFIHNYGVAVDGYFPIEKDAMQTLRYGKLIRRGWDMKSLVVGMILATCVARAWGMQTAVSSSGSPNALSDLAMYAGDLAVLDIQPHTGDEALGNLISQCNTPCAVLLEGRCSLLQPVVMGDSLVRLQLYQSPHLMTITLNTPALKMLDLAYCAELTGIVIAQPNVLETVFVPYCTRLSIDIVIAMVRSCPALKLLDIRGIGFTDEQIQRLQALNKELEILYKDKIFVGEEDEQS